MNLKFICIVVLKHRICHVDYKVLAFIGTCCCLLLLLYYGFLEKKIEMRISCANNVPLSVRQAAYNLHDEGSVKKITETQQ